MRLPIDSVGRVLKAGFSARRETDAPLRVAVYVDASAPRGLVECVRDAFVPRTTAALVRVERLAATPTPPRPDTDVLLVLTSGSEVLEDAVRDLVVAGVPVAVIAESSVEVPFIEGDTPLLGLIAATDSTYLLDTLARWILDRTEKGIAFASNFAFMRIAAANRVITQAALANAATGALAFVPGADFPVMAVTELGMVLNLSAIFGYKLEPERGYEIAAVLAAGFALRGVARLASRSAGHLAFIAKAAVACAGTFCMGRALAHAYEVGIDYTPLNARIAGLIQMLRGGRVETDITAPVQEA